MMEEENKEKEIYARIANFIYETNIHSKTPRSGFWFLGSGEQSVAEHLFHTAMIAYSLAHLQEGVDKNKVVLMALFHDLGEGRTSDHSYVHQRYGRLSEANAIEDLSRTLPFGKEIKELFAEEQARETAEAQLVKDADQLEWISTLRAEEVKGNTKAKEWIEIGYKRLKTEVGKKMGLALMKKNPDEWWFNQNDEWFVDRKEEDKKWNPN